MLQNVIKQSHYTRTCGACYGVFRIVEGNGGASKELRNTPFKSEGYEIRFKRFEYHGQSLDERRSTAGNKPWFCINCFPKIKDYLARVSFEAMKELPEDVSQFAIELEGISCVFKRSKIKSKDKEEIQEED